MASKVPKIKTIDGYEIPQLGFGTWSVQSPPGEVYNAVKYAIGAGYRHIDAAYCYGNEKEVGDAIREKIEDGTVKREDLYVVSKLWNTHHRRDLVAHGFQLSMDALGLDYLDAYLMHWPYGFKDGDDRFPKDADGKFIYSDATFLEAYQGMEDLVEQGKIRSIGLCSFNSEQIQTVWDAARVKPSILQIELNPYMRQTQLRKFAAEKGITVIGFSPLGSQDRPVKGPDDPHLMSDPIVKAVAQRCGLSNAQVLLRWNIQSGNIVIPKSVYENEIAENITVFDYSLPDDAMEELNSFPDNHFRGISQSMLADHPYYPFNIPF